MALEDLEITFLAAAAFSFHSSSEEGQKQVKNCDAGRWDIHETDESH